jgi:hypothetical protein
MGLVLWSDWGFYELFLRDKISQIF